MWVIHQSVLAAGGALMPQAYGIFSGLYGHVYAILISTFHDSVRGW